MHAILKKNVIGLLVLLAAATFLWSSQTRAMSVHDVNGPLLVSDNFNNGQLLNADSAKQTVYGVWQKTSWGNESWLQESDGVLTMVAGDSHQQYPFSGVRTPLMSKGNFFKNRVVVSVRDINIWENGISQDQALFNVGLFSQPVASLYGADDGIELSISKSQKLSVRFKFNKANSAPYQYFKTYQNVELKNADIGFQPASIVWTQDMYNYRITLIGYNNVGRKIFEGSTNWGSWQQASWENSGYGSVLSLGAKRATSWNGKASVSVGTVDFALAYKPAYAGSSYRVYNQLDFLGKLRDKSERRMIMGQQVGDKAESLEKGYQAVLDLETKTNGEFVGMLGFDIDGNKDEDFDAYMDLIAPHAYAGGLVTLSLHLRNPWVEGEQAASSSGQTQLFKEIGSFSEIFDENHDAYKRFWEMMDTTAELIKRMQDAGIVVLFRPLHEMSGGWFWWGDHANGPTKQEYVRLFRAIFDAYTKREDPLDNIIWVWSPSAQHANVMDYYPGNEYVDIVGLDQYTGHRNSQGQVDLSMNEAFNEGYAKWAFDRAYNALVATGKPMALTEFGPAADNCGVASILNGSCKDGEGNVIAFDENKHQKWKWGDLIRGIQGNNPSGITYPEIIYTLAWDNLYGEDLSIVAHDDYWGGLMQNNYVFNRGHIANWVSWW